MIVSGRNLSLIGRAALSSAGGARASQRPAPEPVEPSSPLRDATSTEYRDLRSHPLRDRAVPADIAAGGPARQDTVPSSDDPEAVGSTPTGRAVAAYQGAAAAGEEGGPAPDRLDVVA